MMTNFVTESMDELKDAGYKYTQRRADLLAAFDQAEGQYLTAKEVQQTMEDKHPGMSFDTIYRNLKLFSDFHFLEETDVNGEMLFRKHCDPEIGHHHHFICENCGRAFPLEMCPLDFFSDQVPGAEIHSHDFKIMGLCADCSKQGK